jgi:hypothetical protein
MKDSVHIYMIVAALAMMLFISGCAGHGRLTLQSRSGSDALLNDLLSRTNQYVVHYHGNSEKLVSGLIFDPKDDNKHIRVEGALWNEVSDAETIASIADIILTANEPHYFPNLYQVNDPQGNFYGYLITGWTGVVIKPVDQRTLRVYGLKGPPEYEYGPRHYRSGGR